MSQPIVKLLVNDSSFNAKLKGAIKTFASLSSAANSSRAQFSKFADSIAQVAQSQQLLNTALKSNPYGLMAQAATMAFTKIIEKATAATDAEMRAAEWAQQKADLEQSANEAIGRSVGDLMAKYEMLRVEWESLSTSQEKIDWIKNNQSAFKSLNLAVTDVTSAEDIFVNNTSKVVAALKARAEAEAYAEMYKDQIKKNAMDKATGKYAPRRANANVRDFANEEKAGITAADINWEYKNAVTEGGDWSSEAIFKSYKASGLKKLQDIYEMGSASLENAGRMQAEQWANMMAQAQQNANALSNNNLFGFKGGGGKSGGGGSKAQLTEMQMLQKSIQDLEMEYLKLENITTEQAIKRKSDIQAEINANEQRISQIKLLTEQAHGKLLGGNVDTMLQANVTSSLIPTIDDIREQIARNPIIIPIQTAQRDIKAIGESAKIAASMVDTIGQAFNAIEDPAAKVMGTVAQAIATVALAYADTLAKDQSSKSNIWAFIAAAAAATVSMAATIASVHQATGYAQGGMVEGNSYSGDNIPIMANAGEVVLTKAMSESLARSLTNQGDGGYVPSHISGEQIYIALNRYMRRSGRGEIVTWKS